MSTIPTYYCSVYNPTKNTSLRHRVRKKNQSLVMMIQVLQYEM